MSEHTPGPWKAVESRSKDGWMIASVENGELCDPVVWQMGGIDHEPNAHLIAAAPDLLAACEELLQDQKQRPGAYIHTDLNGIYAAVAKARGGF